MKTNALAALGSEAPTADGLRDIAGPVRIVPWWTWITAAVVLAALLLAAWALWRARKRRLSQPPPPAPPEPADAWARRELARALGWIGDPDRFCTGVSRILREYLERRFGWNASDRTTEEFLRDLEGRAEFDDAQRRQLSEFLTRCDQVKFARHDPTEAELLAVHQLATRLVEETQPLIVPEQAPVPSAPPTR